MLERSLKLLDCRPQHVNLPNQVLDSLLLLSQLLLYLPAAAAAAAAAVNVLGTTAAAALNSVRRGALATAVTAIGLTVAACRRRRRRRHLAEYALESSEQKNGLFTYAVLEALDGKEGTDANKDGSVTMSELADYVKTRVAALTNNNFPKQRAGTKSSRLDLVSIL